LTVLAESDFFAPRINFLAENGICPRNDEHLSASFRRSCSSVFFGP
jgi:hypothetical protein